MLKVMRHISLVAALLLAAATLSAQQPQAGVNIVLKDGKTVTTSRMRRNGSSVMVSVQAGTGTGEIGYPVANIARIEFPEPPEIKQARDFLAQGKAGAAIGVLRPMMDAQEPFRDLPGCWWSQAAQLRLSALVAAGRDSEADALVAQMAGASTDPEALLMVRVQQAASWTRKGQHDKALAVYDEAIKQSASRDTLAAAWLNKGHSLLAQQKWEPAVLAYLHIPVFYADHNLLVPQALLGSARALAGMQEYAEAHQRLDDIVQEFPASPEAAVAKAEMEKLNKKQ